MNLIDEAWIPFRCRDGRVEEAPPAAVADPEVIGLALPRADYQAAGCEFLIGLLQTACAPANRKVWRQLWEEPPSRGELQSQLEPFRGAFELFGDGPRFMQDLDPMSDARNASVASLLIEAPGDQALKQNTDHFSKRGIAEEMCPACSALGLFNLQTTGPAGGTGYRVGVRGGGPLTTVVLPQEEGATLWRKLLLNLLTRDVYEYADPEPDDWRVFPWLGATRTSESNSPTAITTPEDVHPLHIYWAMPNRIRLEADEEPGVCAVCGRTAEAVVRRIRIKNYGYNYEGSWIHPMTPYYCQNPSKSDPPISQKGQQGGLGYRHWEAFVLEDTQDQKHMPASVVQDYIRTKYQTLDRLGHVSRQARLWVFGYDLKQNKPRGWYSIEMPLIAVDEELRDRLLDWVRRLNDAANATVWQTRKAVKEAWFARPSDVKGDLTFIDLRVWEETEQDFYRCLGEMADRVEGSAVLPPDIGRRWQRVLQRTARSVFDDLALSGEGEARDLKRVIAARNRLRAWLSSGKQIKNLTPAAQEEEAA